MRGRRADAGEQIGWHEMIAITSTRQPAGRSATSLPHSKPAPVGPPDLGMVY